MTARLLPFPAVVFGVCPICRREGELLNVERRHWGVCVAHRLKWCIGSNLFSAWRDEAPETWAKNAAVLGAYREVTS